MEQYPAVRGMAKPLFFWSHRELEGGQGSNEGRSKFNNHEVEAAVALARCATCSTSYICMWSFSKFKTGAYIDLCTPNIHAGRMNGSKKDYFSVWQSLSA